MGGLSRKVLGFLADGRKSWLGNFKLCMILFAVSICFKIVFRWGNSVELRSRLPLVDEANRGEDGVTLPTWENEEF